MSVSLAAGSGQPKTTGLSDIVSQGYEVELTDNRTHNWCSKFTGAQQIAIDTAVGPEQSTPSRERLPVRTSARGDSLPDNGDGRGAPYWITLPILGGDTPETTYSNDLISPDLFSVSNVGKPRTQVRKYRWPTVTNSTFTEGRLKCVSVGGAVDREDQGSIGCFGTGPSTLPGSFRGVVLALDPPPPRSSIPPATTSISPPATASTCSTIAPAPTSSSMAATRSRTAASGPSPAIPTAPFTRGALSSRVASS